eukprot:157564-Rhodomonas_salina.8
MFEVPRAAPPRLGLGPGQARYPPTRMVLCAYMLATRCPVQTWRMILHLFAFLPTCTSGTDTAYTCYNRLSAYAKPGTDLACCARRT